MPSATKQRGKQRRAASAAKKEATGFDKTTKEVIVSEMFNAIRYLNSCNDVSLNVTFSIALGVDHESLHYAEKVLGEHP